jgi:limonene-1,2-epoxide hydrolase
LAGLPLSGQASWRQLSEEDLEQIVAIQGATVCIVENIFEEGEWAILEWRDPLGLRGCGVFHVVDSRIVFQRGYWDKLTFLRVHGLPVPNE